MSYADFRSWLHSLEVSWLQAIAYVPPRSFYRKLGGRLMAGTINQYDAARLKRRLDQFRSKNGMEAI